MAEFNVMVLTPPDLIVIDGGQGQVNIAAKSSKKS